MAGDAVKQKWKNLRDSYTKYLKYRNGSTVSAKKYRNWPWATHLEFLKDTIALRSTSFNDLETSELHDDVAHVQDADNSESTTSPSQVLSSTKTPKRKGVTEDVAAVLKYLENKKKYESHLDHIDHLFLTYAHTFKTFSPRTQAILKMELAQLFGQAELSEFDTLTSTQSSP